MTTWSFFIRSSMKKQDNSSKESWEAFESLRTEKRLRVLDAAMDEFAEHGPAAASVNRIVRKGGIAKGSLFSYFGSKDGLLEYLFRASVGRFKGPLKRVRETTRDQDVFLRLEASFLAGVDFLSEHPRIYRLYLHVLFQENFPLRERFLAEVRQYAAKYLRGLVDDGVERGELAPGLDRDLAVFLLDALWDRLLQALCVPGMDGGAGLYGLDREAAAERVRALVRLLRSGMAAESKASEDV